MSFLVRLGRETVTCPNVCPTQSAFAVAPPHDHPDETKNAATLNHLLTYSPLTKHFPFCAFTPSPTSRPGVLPPCTNSSLPAPGGSATGKSGLIELTDSSPSPAHSAHRYILLPLYGRATGVNAHVRRGVWLVPRGVNLYEYLGLLAHKVAPRISHHRRRCKGAECGNTLGRVGGM